MQPRYMGRIMNTYPVSEPEMDNISSLNAQTTVRFAASTFLAGLAASIWTNAMFVTDLTPEAKVTSYFVAPLLVLFAIAFAIGGCVAHFKRNSKWQSLKNESVPIQAVAQVVEVSGPPEIP